MNRLAVHERIDAIVTRVDALEEWMEAFKLQMTDVGNEVKAITRLTEETHGTAQEVYDFLAPAVWFFKTLGAIGRGAVHVVTFLGRLAKPLFWLFAIIAAGLGYYKTGSWHMPDWWNWFE